MFKKKKRNSENSPEAISLGLSVSSSEQEAVTETAELDKKTGLSKSPDWKRKLLYPAAIVTLLFLVGMGVMAKNNWLPATDALTGKKTGWFGAALSNNASSNWNPFAATAPAPVVTGTPQLSKEYIYAGSRMLAVEDAGANPPGFEGDVRYRPNQAENPNPGQSGNGQILSDDIVQIRRFQNGTDVADPATNEFQKADVAPYDNRGDGKILSDDVVQARRFQNGTDPLTAAAGPTEPSPLRSSSDDLTGKKRNNALRSESSTEPVKVKPVLVSRVANKLTIGIELDTDSAGAGVNALSFTLNYDPAVLSPVNNCQPGSGGRTAGAINILCNFGQPGSGFVAAIVDLDPDQTFSFGAQQIGLIEFTVAAGAEATTAFNFGDAPSQRSMSDALGNLLTATFAANTISLTAQ